MIFLTINQELPNIEEKIANAPNDDYEIGILIGSLLPMTVLILLAYLMYSYMRRRNKNKRDDKITFDE